MNHESFGIYPRMKGLDANNFALQRPRELKGIGDHD